MQAKEGLWEGDRFVIKAKDNVVHEKHNLLRANQLQFSTEGRVNESTETRYKLFGSVQFTGDHDYVQWALENNQNITERKNKLKQNGKHVAKSLHAVVDGNGYDQ